VSSRFTLQVPANGLWHSAVRVQVTRSIKTVMATAALALIPCIPSAHATLVQILHSFQTSNDGRQPAAGLTLVGSTLYGTASTGGASGNGTVFSINSDGSNYQTLHSFQSTADGAVPYAGLTQVGSSLYGTASSGGTFGDGTVFSINPDGSNFQNLHSFQSSTDGGSPFAGLTQVGSTLYGTAFTGGAYDDGTVFSINPDGSNPQTLYSFQGSGDGAEPAAGLTLVGSTLYSTAALGGTFGHGTVFSIHPDGSDLQTLHSFQGIGGDGAVPGAGLTLVGSTLYGTTGAGGTFNHGTVFSVNVDGSDFQTLHSFQDAGGDGSTPGAGLTQVGSTLYGTTYYGGTLGFGTVFSINVNGSDFQILHSFQANGSDGAVPEAGLTLDGSTLYGTTYGGGAFGSGTVFAISVPEPSTVTLAATGLLGLAGWGWRQRRRGQTTLR